MIVHGEGPKPARIMLVGEAPGAREEALGRPFIGRSGEVLNEALHRANLRRADLYVTNLVKQRPTDKNGNDRAPDDEELSRWAPTFRDELNTIRPEILVTLGATSTRAFLPIDSVGGMETVHGVAKRFEAFTVFPCYHPAAGLHDPATMSDFFWDMKRLGDFSRGQHQLQPDPPQKQDLGVDTEGYVESPWCYTDSDGEMGMMREPQRWAALLLKMIHRKMLFHNGLHDAQVFMTALESLKTQLDKWFRHQSVPEMRLDHDTMVMAYQLGTEPKGLKELVYRYFGEVREDYESIVEPADRHKIAAYLTRALSVAWPAPEGRKQPIERRIFTLLQKLTLGSEAKEKATKSVIYSPPVSPKEIAAAWKDHDVKAVVEAELGPMPRATLADVPLPIAKKYAVQDAVDTKRLKSVLWPQVRAMGLEQSYAMDMAVIPMIADMERVGLFIDREALAYAKDAIRSARATVLERLHEYTGTEEFNPASSDHVAQVFAADGVETGKRTPGGKVSTGKNVLRALAGGYTFAADVYSFREADKLLNTFIPAIEDNIQADGRIHPHFRITNTETGRLSAHSPNLLAFPARTELGKLIRACFRAAPGRRYVGADLDQVEMRIMADESGDTNMIRVIKEGLDMHAYSASQMFKVPIDQVVKGAPLEKKYRTPCKSAGFLVIYEGSAARLQEQLEAEGLKEPPEFYVNVMAGWYKTFPGVRDYQRRRHNEAHTYGYVRDRWGRIRHVEAVWCPDSGISKKAEREAGNFPIQAGAQGQIKKSMAIIAANKQLVGAKKAVRPLLQIHDELIFEVDENKVDEAKKFIVESMTDLTGYKVPITASASSGERWSELK